MSGPKSGTRKKMDNGGKITEFDSFETIRYVREISSYMYIKSKYQIGLSIKFGLEVLFQFCVVYILRY